MVKKLNFLSIAFMGTAFANMAPEGFERFPNYYFVETGTFDGQGIRYALRARSALNTFNEIHSVEIFKPFVDNARRNFLDQSKVIIWYGDSATKLWDVIKNMDKQITFWLDGHSGDSNPSIKHTPIMEELEQIKRHPIKNHTILIDDMHVIGGVLFDYLTKEDLINKIMEINPRYVITYVAGGDEGEYPNNIMVAYVPA
ncbi:MAG: hypothetical protein WD449_00690 [Candidatus Babeliales bacterium]